MFSRVQDWQCEECKQCHIHCQYVFASRILQSWSESLNPLDARIQVLHQRLPVKIQARKMVFCLSMEVDHGSS